MLFRQSPNNSIVLLADMMVLFESSVSCSGVFLTSIADDTGTAVNKAVTS